MKRNKLIWIVALSLALVACGKKDKVENNQVEVPTGEVAVEQVVEVDYSKYEGDWLVDGGIEDRMTAFHQIFGKSGMTIKDIEGNDVLASIFSVAGAPSFRNAEVDVQGEIVDGKLIATYEDKGWGYKGIVELTFEDDKITASILRDEQETTSMWGIPAGDITFVRPIETNIINIDEDFKAQMTEVLKANLAEDESENFEIKMLLEDAKNTGEYYAFVDYMSPKGVTEKQKVFKVMKLEDKYVVEESEVLDSKIEFKEVWSYINETLKASDIK